MKKLHLLSIALAICIFWVSSLWAGPDLSAYPELSAIPDTEWISEGIGSEKRIFIKTTRRETRNDHEGVYNVLTFSVFYSSYYEQLVFFSERKQVVEKDSFVHLMKRMVDSDCDRAIDYAIAHLTVIGKGQVLNRESPEYLGMKHPNPSALADHEIVIKETVRAHGANL